ncbi:arabinose efflux permease family protein [Cylindrospermum stagnale PCC 7417]|uniref:Arabinose efflux permease family protein n=1 Tax=Cylindrospermum stagnale PCC 7417 TaxID=56107 RepID=K9X289_9NOST|nr:MFS transporter [Cylindrospermum stagnale]AFZ26161.1 arabinose efflux permease family protein [Cylindrospermum stagnale PCC 7417]
MLRLSRYQWTVLLAAWLGWGFNIFNSILFNYVAPNCVPTLLGLTIGSPEAKAATLFWTGLLTSLLLLGWAAGGVIFGQVADRIGRRKTLLLTMLIYALGTASCAFAPNIWVLMLCRIVASLGIGGEWASGAAMVAEVVPENSRVEAGALLYTSASAGLLLATFVNFQIAGVLFAGSPETSWRYVFLCGLIPAVVAFAISLFLKEPERWQRTATTTVPPKLGELFNRQNLPLTISSFLMALTALLTWWSCNAFIPVIATGLAQTSANAQGLGKSATLALVEQWKVIATNSFNLGGFIGTLLTIPAAKYLGRKKMFVVYFILSSAAIMVTFGLPLPPQIRLYLYFAIGISVFGVFGSFTYYLPELFPTRLRATGAGFCYNIGRVVAAIGPFLVGAIASQGANALNSGLQVLFWVGFIPLLGLAFMPWVIETKGQILAD